MKKSKFEGPRAKGYHPMRKFYIIMSGLKFAVVQDFSVLYKIILSFIVLVPVLIYNTYLDASMIILATTVMITAELLNTAIEAVCDYMQPEFDERIGIIKDVAAAATGVAIFGWIIVLVIEVAEVWSHF